MPAPSTPPAPTSIWSLGPSLQWTFPAPMRVMGILNVTPDSFSDGGRWIATSAAVERAFQIADEGADILDLGGESTRPGSLPVEPREQLRRVLPVLKELAGRLPIPISIDTSSSLVARESLAAGAQVVNDVTALTADAQLVDVCAAEHCGIILMHMQGKPLTMQEDPRYDDVVRDVTSYLKQRVQDLVARGIDATRLMVDPGIGFGKTAAHNLQLLSNIAALRSTGRPVLIGHSRKRFLQKVLGRPLEEATAGTIGIAIAVAQQGAELVRVHDVRAVKDALLAWQTVSSRSPD